MHLGVERPGFRRFAKWRDRFRMPPLLREGDTEVEQSVRILRAILEHDTKRPLGLGELFLLQALPAVSEARVHVRHRR
jgi:hypothetical protein